MQTCARHVNKLNTCYPDFQSHRQEMLHLSRSLHPQASGKVRTSLMEDCRCVATYYPQDIYGDTRKHALAARNGEIFVHREKFFNEYKSSFSSF
jgi:hypothetical protein